MIYERSLASHPRSAQWHPTLNGQKVPRGVYKNNNNKFWFTCETCHHDFDASPNNITSKNTWCPYCFSRSLCTDKDCTMCHEKSFASYPKSSLWHPTLNGLDVPRQSMKHSHRHFWFTCDICQHVFNMSLHGVASGHWCAYCSNPPLRLCEDTECEHCYNKSFASHPGSSQWHQTMNGRDVPRDFFKNCSKKKWFSCETCHHDFDMTPNNITNKGQWCPYCSNSLLCDDADCVRCHEKSFASQPRSSRWHPTMNGRYVPRQFFKGSQKKFWFSCETCIHDFKTDLASKTWCPYCGNVTLCPDVECTVCFNKSFASHPKSSQWHPTMNGRDTPRYFSKNSNKKKLFSCETCHNDFEMTLTSINSGRWCGKCKHKTERKLHTTLKEAWPSTVHQFKQEWCMNKKRLPFDFCIPEKKVIIELDGRQHFRQVSNWTTPEACLENYVFKQKSANENGYSVVRIIQEDVWFDRYDWRTKLQETIDGIHDGDCMNVFLCENGEYDSRRAALIYAC